MKRTILALAPVLSWGGGECPASPDGRHCRKANGEPRCQFCGAGM